jgi:hypothetical protein
VAADSVLGAAGSLPSLRTVAFLLCPDMAQRNSQNKVGGGRRERERERERERGCTLVSSFFFFWRYWSLNSWPIHLEPLHYPFFVMGIFKIESHELFAQG